jgi:hypothetical protein
VQEYAFEVKLTAAVRVNAPNESLSRKVLTSALGSPNTAELRLANDINTSIAKDITVTLASFSPANELGWHVCRPPIGAA